MKMPRFLKTEAASLLIGLSLRPDVFKPMTSWPPPEHWTEEETEEFFMAFNLHHTKLDAEAVKKNLPLTSRAVNFKNVALFLAVLMLKESVFEAQQEVIDEFNSVLKVELNHKAAMVFYAKPDDTGTPSTKLSIPKPWDDLGSGQTGNNR